MQDLFRTLAGVVNDIGAADELTQAVVFATWRRVAGETLAGHAVPVKLEDGKLSIAVSGLTWQRHLQDLAGQLLFKLNAALGSPSIRFIEFGIDEGAIRAARADRTPADDGSLRERAMSEMPLEIRQAAAAISDDGLREDFLAAAAICLARRSAKYGSGS